MLPSFLLSLREGLEAALIVGILLGALRKMNRPQLRPTIWAGVLAALLLSLLAGLALTLLGLQFEGQAEKIFEGLIMLTAAGLLTWVIFWMNRQAREMRNDLEDGVRRATGRRALFGVSFLAVVREGVELALFLTAASFASDAASTLVGALLGLTAAIALGWLLSTAALRLNLGQFFRVTGILLILFAAGLVAHGVHELNEAGWIPAVIEHVWDTNSLLDENSVAGSLLKALFGYNGNPSLTEVLAYLAYLLAVLAGLRVAGRASSPAPA